VAGPGGFWLSLEHPDYEAKVLSWPPADGSQLTREIMLSAAAGASIRVVTRDGRPVPGAKVHVVFDCSAEDLGGEWAARTLERALYLARYQTDAGGAAVVVPLGEVARVVASLGDESSQPWVGKLVGEHRIVLGPTFQLSGSVLGRSVQRPGNVRWAVDLSGRQVLQSRIPVRRDGSFGPVVLPLVDAAVYHFHLEVEGSAVDQAVRPAPRPGEHVEIRFEHEDALAVSVLVTDEAGAPLPMATVTGNWLIDDKWCKVERLTDAAGLAHFRNGRASEFWGRARRPGYQSVLLPNSIDLVAHAPSAPIVIALPKAGRLTGRCLVNGQPLSDFLIQFWSGDFNKYNTVIVRGSSTGEFETDEAPLGIVEILAFSEHHPNPPSKTVTVSEGNPARAEFVFEAAITGQGRVFDAVTLAPVAGALVQPWNSVEVGVLSPRGLPTRTDSDGSFTIGTLGSEFNYFEVVAEGYAIETRMVRGVPGKVLDIQPIGLLRSQTLRLELSGTPGFDFTDYMACAQVVDQTPRVRCAADGVFEFANMEPGLVTVNVWTPNEHVRHTHHTMLVPGHEWVVRLPVERRHLEVVVHRAQGVELPPGSRVYATPAAAENEGREDSYPIYPDSPVDVKIVDVGRLGLVVVNEKREPLGATEVEITETGPQRVELHLKSDAREVRVVDRNREPVVDAMVFVATQRSISNVEMRYRTDAEGRCWIRNLDVAQPWILAYDGVHGVSASRPLSSFGDGQVPIVIELHADDWVCVRVQERGRVVPGLRMSLQDPAGFACGLGTMPSDADGLVSWGPTSEGDYVVKMREFGWWPTSMNVRTGSADAPHVLQVRRLGSLAIEAKTGLGTAARGVPIGLRSVEFGAEVVDWIAERKVDAPVGGLITGEDGRLRIDGLPNGEYRWSAVDSEGRPIEGVALVPSAGVGSCEIRVP